MQSLEPVLWLCVAVIIYKSLQLYLSTTSLSIVPSFHPHSIHPNFVDWYQHTISIHQHNTLSLSLNLWLPLFRFLQLMIIMFCLICFWQSWEKWVILHIFQTISTFVVDSNILINLYPTFVSFCSGCIIVTPWQKQSKHHNPISHKSQQRQASDFNKASSMFSTIPPREKEASGNSP